MGYVSIYVGEQQGDLKVRGTRNRKFVIKLTKCLLAGIACLLLLSPLAMAKLSGSLSIEAITERLKPAAKINVDGGASATTSETTAIIGVGGPKDIYEQNCKMCHQTGLAGAPKLGNKGDWAPRIQQGLDTLVKAAWNGIRAMPPKGNCLKCTEDDIKQTVQYMLDASK